MITRLIIDELQEFRLGLKTRLDEQKLKFILLQNTLEETETDLESIVKVVEKKQIKYIFKRLELKCF